jgi:transcriptional regulator with XRE-family HTH domain
MNTAAQENPTTETKVAFILKALEASGVSMTDFARLTGVSRTSLYAWKRGGHVADRLRLTVAFNTAVRLDRAAEQKMLPLEDMYSVAERLAELRRIVAAVNQGMRV